MGNDEGTAPSKSDKASSPVKEQPAIHPYPDWAAMQAYYGPGVPMPPPYFGTAVAPGHAPHPYMWGPQPSVAPFGMPYPGVYPHGVYPHPSVTLGTHSYCQGIAPSPTTTEAVVMAEACAKPLTNKARSLMKKFKGFNGLAVSVGNGKGEDVSGDSLSGETAEFSSDGSDGNNQKGGSKTQRNTSSENLQTSGNKKVDTQSDVLHGGETNASSNMALGVAMVPSTVAGKPIGTAPVSGLTPGMESTASGPTQLKSGGAPATTVLVPVHDGVHPELWRQDERELKRERRKQSNRESARRSRLRKQAETEELAIKVETMSGENMTLRSEICRLKDDSEKLRIENSALMEKLKNVEQMLPDESATQGRSSVVVENFLSRIDKLREDEAREDSSGKLRQLLDASSRADAVAAG